ncbi:hypothetical protein Nepgr_008250 [Nepenthes gracilis]|uniref:Filament-like plant protein 7 n=1 Tax=Nepenthes gracilis TaxID=150966 RepID=A0AAD3S8E1_NEPGR|nr:hypothetical protein Nepgr_008250 [Nepenthes gracilis]
MTDHKSWLWSRKSSEKSIAVTEKVEFASKGNEEEMHMLLAEKAELERELQHLSDKLSSALSESNVKDDLAKKHAKTAQEALAGWEKAEAKAQSLKQELNESVRHRVESEDRASHLDAAVKECMQQLRFVREEQEQRIHDAITTVSREFEKTRLTLEEKLAECSIKIAKLGAENTQLSKVLLLKEQMIEDLNQQRTKADADFSALLARLKSVEKDNTSLKYEVRVLEKELDIRNEEKEFNRRAADEAHRQYLENVKKIAKLESECQRLRILVRKRLPGPAALLKMKNEVQILEKGPSDSRRKMLNANLINPRQDYVVDDYPESPSKKIDILTERLCILEEENNALKEALYKKANELQISRNIYSQSASRLSQIEAHIEESSKGSATMELARNRATSHDLSLASMSDIGSEAGSWACALISELEHFRGGKQKGGLSCKSVGVSDISLMDDFVEMEKLALVCVDKPTENHSPEATGRENSSREKSFMELWPNLRRSISRLVEIIEGINLFTTDGGSFAYKSLGNLTGYTVRVFNFMHACSDMLDGKADFETFIQGLTSIFEWTINSLRSEGDLDDAGLMSQFFEADKSPGLKGQAAHFPLSVGSDLHGAVQKADLRCDMSEEIKRLKDELVKMESVRKELENRLQSTTEDRKSLLNQLQKSEENISSLQYELEGLKNSKRMIEDQIENHRLTIKDLNLQLLAIRTELNEAHQKCLSQEAELKNKGNLCEELQAKSLELQLQLESVTNSDGKKHSDEEEKQLDTEQEISAASEKLAQCQETILNLGKQLKALASPRNAVLFDKVLSSPTNSVATITNAVPENKKIDRRASLLDQMLAEDDVVAELLESPKTKEMICDADANKSPKDGNSDSGPKFKGLVENGKEMLGTGGQKKNDVAAAVGSLAIVPSKKKSGGLFQRLLWRKKRVNNKMPPLPFV